MTNDPDVPALLPTLFVCVVDGDVTVGQSLQARLRCRDASIPVASFGQFSLAVEAFEHLIEDGKSLPAVVVTDDVGTQPGGMNFVETFAPRFGKTPFICFSEDGPPSPEAVELQHRGLLRARISKSQPDLLTDAVVEAFHWPTQDRTLNSLRDYIAQRANPRAPFFRGASGRLLSLIDVYWEICRDTPDGKHLRSLWDQLQNRSWTNQGSDPHASISEKRS